MDKGLGLKILLLRSQGRSYNEIVVLLGCSKSVIAYHCGKDQKKKTKLRALKDQDKHKERKAKVRHYLLEFSWRYKRLCGCKICGEKDPIVLEYDHIDASKKLAGVAQMIGNRHSIESIKEEIRKCQVLCANCHKRKTHKDLNYFKM